MIQSITKNLISSQQSVDGGRNAYGSNAPESTVCGLLRGNKCQNCGIVFIPYKNKQSQKFCGSKKDKIGCSWIVSYQKSFKRSLKSVFLKRKTKREQRTCKDCGISIGELDFRCILCKNCSKERNGLKNWKLRFNILKKFNFTCQYCGRKAPEVCLEVEHIFPKSKGGQNSVGNYSVACRECNVGKGDAILRPVSADCSLLRVKIWKMVG